MAFTHQAGPNLTSSYRLRQIGVFYLFDRPLMLLFWIFHFEDGGWNYDWRELGRALGEILWPSGCLWHISTHTSNRSNWNWTEIWNGDTCHASHEWFKLKHDIFFIASYKHVYCPFFNGIDQALWAFISARNCVFSLWTINLLCLCSDQWLLVHFLLINYQSINQSDCDQIELKVTNHGQTELNATCSQRNFVL